MIPKNALFIANRKSGKTQQNDQLDAALKTLKGSGIDLIEEESEDAAHINELIKKHCDKVEAVILAGGDGTMGSAAGTLSEYGLLLGILPTGTANDLARTLKIPESLEAAAAVIVNGRPHDIDLGKVNNHCFINAAHIGLGVMVNLNLTDEMKARWGRFSYARSLIDAFKSMRSFQADIVCDGDGFSVRSIHITVANGRFYGGGLALSEEASVDDHKLRVFSLAPQSFWNFLSHAVVIWGGQLKGREGVWLRSGQSLRVHTSRPLDIYADGELVSKTPATFELQTDALRVYVPDEYFDQDKINDAENRKADRA